MITIWIKKYSKRFFRQPLFLLLLFLLPAGTMMFSYLSHQKSTAVMVGVVSEDTEGMGQRVVEHLVHHPGIAVFVRCDSRETMKRQLADGRLQCGYYFPVGMEERLKNGEYEGIITQYYRRGVMAHSLVAETVFAAVYDQYGESMVTDYVMNSGLYRTQLMDEEQIARLYREQHEKENTFGFSYDEETPSERSLGDYLTAPLKGVMSLLILLSGFCGMMVWQEDKKKGLWLMAPARLRQYLPVISTGIPVVYLTLAGLMSEMLSRFSFLSLKEIACMGIYDIMVILFVNIFAYISLPAGVMWGISLGTVFASAVATPIFVNLPAVIPGLGLLAWVCPPAYYLKAVYGSVSAVMCMVEVTVLLLAVCWCLRRKEGKR